MKSVVWAYIGLVLTTSLAASPSAAAPNKNCVVDQVTPELAAATLEAVRAGRSAALDAFSSLMIACQRSNSWSDGATDSAIIYSVQTTVARAVAAQSRFSPAQIAQIDAALARLPLEFMQRWAANPTNPAQTDRMAVVGALMTTGIQFDGTDFTMIAGYMGAVSRARVAGAAFDALP